MLKVYFYQCQILKISSNYKEMSQFTVHPLEMHTFYLKYHFVKSQQGHWTSLKQNDQHTNPPCAVCRTSIQHLDVIHNRLQVNTEFLPTLPDLPAITSSLYLTIFIYWSLLGTGKLVKSHTFTFCLGK